MTPADKARAKKLHGMMSSSFKHEADTARWKLRELLAEHGMTLRQFNAELKREEKEKAAADAAAQAAKQPPPPSPPPIQVPQAHIDQLALYLAEQVKEQYGVDVLNDAIAMRRLKEAAEAAILALLASTSTRVCVPYLTHDRSGQPVEFVYWITRNEFEDVLKGTPPQSPPFTPSSTSAPPVTPAQSQQIGMGGVLVWIGSIAAASLIAIANEPRHTTPTPRYEPAPMRTLPPERATPVFEPQANISTGIYSGIQVITITGTIGPNDYARFKDQVERVEKRDSRVIVSLSSDGGSLSPAFAIGSYIRQKDWVTFVSEECDSACAAIWIGGATRYMTPGARIGFHAAWEGNGQVSGSGNALLGSYFNDMGLGLKAIDWAASSAPSTVSNLSMAKAKDLGIDVEMRESLSAVIAELNAREKIATVFRSTVPPKIALSDLRLRNLALTDHAKAGTYCSDWIPVWGCAGLTLSGVIANNHSSITITHLLFEVWLKDKNTWRYVGQTTAWVGGNCGDFSLPPGQERAFTTCRFSFDNVPPDAVTDTFWRIKQINLDTVVEGSVPIDCPNIAKDLRPYIPAVFRNCDAARDQAVEAMMKKEFPWIVAPAPGEGISLPAGPGSNAKPDARNCAEISVELASVFPGAFGDCITPPMANRERAQMEWIERKTWDSYVPSSKRYITRTLQGCTSCAPNIGPYYHLIAKDHDASGGSNGGSVCYITASSGDCETTGGGRYQLKQASIKWFLAVADGCRPRSRKGRYAQCDYGSGARFESYQA